jgi:hypothetical protein
VKVSYVNLLQLDLDLRLTGLLYHEEFASVLLACLSLLENMMSKGRFLLMNLYKVLDTDMFFVLREGLYITLSIIYISICSQSVNSGLIISEMAITFESPRWLW